jgi:hypothetical protein
MGQGGSKKGKGDDAGGVSTKVDNFNLKAKRVNIMEQKLKNARATGLLALQASKLKEFPAEALAIAKMRQLDLSDNAIREVPSGIAALSQLKTLKLAGNKLGSGRGGGGGGGGGGAGVGAAAAGGASGFGAAADALLGCTALQSLALDRNGLHELPQLPPKIKSLTAAGNALTALPAALRSCAPLLKTLDLSSNRLELLDPSLCIALVALEELVLDDNQLLMLPDEIVGMARLRSLSARRNRLQAVPPAVLRDSAVDKMHLEGNAITKRQFMETDGFEEFQKKRELLKKKDIGIAMEMSGMDLCGLDAEAVKPPGVPPR